MNKSTYSNTFTNVEKIVILGGGISALAAAWYIQEKFPKTKITIVEKKRELGGWIQTMNKKGYLFDQGPKSLRSFGSGRETLRLVKSLGLEDQVIKGSQLVKYRYLYTNGKISAVPYNLASLCFSAHFWKNLWSILREFSIPKSENDDETIYNFFLRRFNKEITETFADSIATGIFAGDIKELSIRSCFPILYEWEKMNGSVLRSLFKHKRKQELDELDPWIKEMQKSSIFSFQKGMGTLVEALKERVRAEYIFENEVKKIAFSPKISITVESMQKQSKSIIEADFLISAVPAYVLANLLESHNCHLSQLLKEIPYSSVTTVHFGFKESFKNLNGFGYLIPRKEKEEVLGTVWDSSAFREQNQYRTQTRLTVMIRGTRRDVDVIEMAKNALAKHLSITAEPDFIACTVCDQAIPQYLVGHYTKASLITTLASQLSPKFKILGNYLHGVSVNDCIANAERLAESLSEYRHAS